MAAEPTFSLVPGLEGQHPAHPGCVLQGVVWELKVCFDQNLPQICCAQVWCHKNSKFGHQVKANAAALIKVRSNCQDLYQALEVLPVPVQVSERIFPCKCYFH